MEIVDSHHHFWRYEAAEYPWIDAPLAMLRRDFLCQELCSAVAGCGVTGAISVQARTTPEETEFLLREAERCPLVAGVVGWAPLKCVDVIAMLERWRENAWFKGVREICQGTEDAAFFENGDFNRGVRALTQLDIPYDLLLYHDQLPSVTRFVDRHPNQRFVLDHIAKPAIRAAAFGARWRRDLRELARRGNVIACKFSGVVTEVRDSSWSVALLRPYFDAALEAFGAHRLMFGSDWPVCLQRTGYHEWVVTVEELVQGLTVAEREAFFSGNAARVYALDAG